MTSPLGALPPDYVMENVLELPEQQQHHHITFYQAALTTFSVKASNGSMMMEEYNIIRDVCLGVQNGESLGSFKCAGYLKVDAWVTMFAVVVSGESTVVVNMFAVPKRKFNP